MKTVLITGVTGKIGANLAVELVRRGYQVRGTVMPGDPRAAKADTLDIEKVVCDLRDTDGLLEATKGVDAVVHLAAAMGKFPGMNDRDYFDVNVTGTWNVIYAASKSAPSLERFVFASTDAVYSAYQGQYLPMDEKHPRLTYFPYGMVKLLGEEIVEHFRRQENMPTVICRFGTVLAASEILSFFTSRFPIGILKGAAADPRTNVFIAGVSEPWKIVEQAAPDPDTLVIPRDVRGRAWIHNFTGVRDTVQGAILALEKPEAIGETFNIHAAEGTRWDEAVLYLHGKTGKPHVEVQVPNYLEFYLDISKARRMLGYSPVQDYRVLIDEALAFEEGEDVGIVQP